MFRKLVILSTIFAATSYSVQASDVWGKFADALAYDVWNIKGTDPTPDDHWDLTATDWLMFASGLLVGFSEQLATKGIDSPCISDSANMAVCAVHASDYMNIYIESDNQDQASLAYGLVYIIDFFETYSTWDCEADDFATELNVWLNDLTGSFSAEKTDETDEDLFVESSYPIVQNHEDFQCDDCFGGEGDVPLGPTDEEILDEMNLIDGMLIFITVREILNDVEIMLQVIETGIHSNQVWDNWKQAKYYSAGYHLGSSGLGLGIMIDDIVTKYKEMSYDYDGATDLTEETEDDHSS